MLIEVLLVTSGMHTGCPHSIKRQAVYVKLNTVDIHMIFVPPHLFSPKGMLLW